MGELTFPADLGSVLIRCVPWDAERYGWAQALAEEIPGAILIEDEDHNAYNTFLKALRAQGELGAWHLEDDLVLTSRWVAKATWVARSHRNHIIQGYSDRKQDETIGSRLEPGRAFTMNQCFWVPGAVAPDMLAFAEGWPERGASNYDPMMAEFMKQRELHYYVHVPSLVQHRIAKSVIDPRRSSRRQSRTFIP